LLRPNPLGTTDYIDDGIRSIEEEAGSLRGARGRAVVKKMASQDAHPKIIYFGRSVLRIATALSVEVDFYVAP
jgi:hypothetical protein